MMETDTSRSRNIEFALYALAFGLALALRLLRLGELPLSDDEARWAMQAFDLMKGLRPEIGPQPLYVLLTAVAFFVFDATNFAARLVPALFGAALVLGPFFFRDRLGSKAAILLAFFLAFEPGLLAMSRLAGSPILAVSAVVLAWGLWRNGNLRAAGVLAGVALLGGPLLWAGVIGLAISYGLSRGFVAKQESVPFERKSLLTALAYVVGTYLALGSLFLLAPGGLGAGLASIVEYFRGWLDFTDVPGWRLLVALMVYQLPAVILAIVTLVRGILKRNDLVISLGIWLFVTLVFALANPYRQVTDLAWALLPLWALAALEVSLHLNPIADGAWETLGMMAFTLAILAFAAQNFTTLALAPVDDSTIQLRWIILLGSLVLLAFSIVMVAFGWSVAVAVQGSVWGGLVVLAVYGLAVSMAAGGLRTYRTIELWTSGYLVKQADALGRQMQDLSRWKMGAEDSLDVTVAGVDSPGLHWALRDWNTTFTDSLTVSGNPAIIIASDQISNPDLESGYRGEAITWRTSPDWNGGIPSDWLRWLILHDFPQGREQLILWVRSDVFIDIQNANP